MVGEAVALGHLTGDLDAAQFVWALDGIYLAHHVSQRLMRDPDADARANAAFEALVASSRPESTLNPEWREQERNPTREVHP